MKLMKQTDFTKPIGIFLGFLCVIMLMPCELPAQEIEPTYISLSDGLANPDVREIFQDSYGLIWIATANGLQVYDGYHFETFKNISGRSNSLLHNQVWGITEDDEHNIWVGHEQGISKLDRTTLTFTNYDIAALFNETGGNGRVFKVKIDSQKRIWALSVANEILQYNKESDTWDFAPYELNDSTIEKEHVGPMLAFAEDDQGGLWVSSSRHGLMFRGITDNAFKPIRLNEEIVVDFTNAIHSITEIYIDSTQVLWLTTRNGVFKYNPQNGKIKTIQTYDYNQSTIWNHWNHIQADPEGNIWISNNFRGILKFDGISDNYQELKISGAYRIQNIGWNTTLTRFTIDKSGIFWFGSRTQGLLKYDPEKNPFAHFQYDENDPTSITSNAIFGLLASEFNPDVLYVGTRGTGMNVFNRTNQIFTHVPFAAEEDMYGGAVRSIGEDKNGGVWLGTWGDGLIKLDRNWNEIKRFKYVAQDIKSISDNQIRVIQRDSKGNFWIGTNQGLNYFNLETEEFQRISSEDAKLYPMELINIVDKLAESNRVVEIINVSDDQKLHQDFKLTEAGNFLITSVGEGTQNNMVDYGWLENAAGDTLWKSTDYISSYYAGGAVKNRMFIDRVRLDPGDYKLRYRSDDSHSYDLWNADAPDQTSLYGIVLCSITDSDLYDLVDGYLTTSDEQLTIAGINIKVIELGKTNLWVGTGARGLNKIDLVSNDVKTYTHDPSNNNSLSSNNIFDVYEDESGLLWITTDLGVNIFDPVSEVFTRYTEEDGLPTNLCESILPGDNGEMWISTQSGLSQMIRNTSLEKVTFINYTSDDGLAGNSYLALAAAKMNDGKIYFGGDHGLNIVSRITTNKIPPDIIVSDLLISNTSVIEMGDESPVAGNLYNFDMLNLSHDQNNLSFEFAAVHYSNPRKNQYAHFLMGYDKDWVYDNRNYASYTNLDPGEYEFLIRASNAYGIWNEEGRSVKIIISPPWYQTWLAYISYGVLLVLGIFGFDRVMRRRLVHKEQERAREQELAHAKEIEKAYNDLKKTQQQLVHSEKMASLGELTAGIAHEIQNPLNFVNNFSDVSVDLMTEMKEEIDQGNTGEVLLIAGDLEKNLEKIHHHGARASSIVRGMLEHSRAGNDEKQPTDINAMADEYIRLAYHGIRAKDKSFNADFKANLDENLPKVKVVGQDIARVVLNLINNAFHAVATASSEAVAKGDKDYKPKVSISTKNMGKFVEIRVMDNGGGIPDEILDKIFQPFFTTKPSGEGTGLGLSISYDIITKGHGGELLVETSKGDGQNSAHGGTTFIIKLPL